MQKIILKKYNALIGAILSLLGFTTACDDMLNVRPEYGIPYGEFQIQGNISNNFNEAVQHIQVELWEYSEYIIDSLIKTDSTYSDENGYYIVNSRTTSFDIEGILKLADIDSTENGVYEGKDTTISFNYNDFPERDNDNRGIAQKTIDIKLKAKE